MIKVFIDANIFFAAVASSTGGSYFILELAKRKKIEIVTVLHALAEAERNIEKKLGAIALKNHHDNLLAVRPTIQQLIDISPDLEKESAEVVPENDIPILAGALRSGIKILITLDRVHFLENQNVQSKFPVLEILTPGGFLQRYISMIEDAKD